MNVVLAQNGVIVEESALRAAFKRRLVDIYDKLTVVYEPKIGVPKKVSMYKTLVDRRTGKVFVIFPRSMFSLFRVRGNDLCIVTFDAPIALAPHIIEPDYVHHNQKVILDYLLANHLAPESIQAGTGAVLINLGAGQGKTLLAAAIILKLNMRALYITKTQVLVDQGIADMKKMLYSDKYRAQDYFEIRQFKEKVRDDGKETGIMFIIVNSALNQDAAFFARWPIIIYDEVHAYCSDKFSEIFTKSQSHVNIGLSATTDKRLDKFDIIAHKWCSRDGAVLHAAALDGFIKNDIVYNCKVKLVHYFAPPEYAKNLTHDSTDKVFVHYMYQQFMHDDLRCATIADEIIALYLWRDKSNRRHTIFAFSDEKDMLYKIYNIVLDKIADKETYKKESYMFISGVDYDVAEKNGYILWSTYPYGTGTSIVRASAIVFITPRKNGHEQILGRILRLGSDVNLPRIAVDIVDERTCLAHQLHERKKSYELYGFKKTHAKVGI